MAGTIVTTHGPRTRQAAPFLPTAGEEVVVDGENETAGNHALTPNSLGHPEIHGSERHETGHNGRPGRSPATVGAGSGAAASHDILTVVATKDVHGGDGPPGV